MPCMMYIEKGTRCQYVQTVTAHSQVSLGSHKILNNAKPDTVNYTSDHATRNSWTSQLHLIETSLRVSRCQMPQVCVSCQWDVRLNLAIATVSTSIWTRALFVLPQSFLSGFLLRRFCSSWPLELSRGTMNTRPSSVCRTENISGS